MGARGADWSLVLQLCDTVVIQRSGQRGAEGDQGDQGEKLWSSGTGECLRTWAGILISILILAISGPGEHDTDTEQLGRQTETERTQGNFCISVIMQVSAVPGWRADRLGLESIGGDARGQYGTVWATSNVRKYL